MFHIFPILLYISPSFLQTKRTNTIASQQKAPISAMEIILPQISASRFHTIKIKSLATEREKERRGELTLFLESSLSAEVGTADWWGEGIITLLLLFMRLSPCNSKPAEVMGPNLEREIGGGLPSDLPCESSNTAPRSSE